MVVGNCTRYAGAYTGESRRVEAKRRLLSRYMACGVPEVFCQITWRCEWSERKPLTRRSGMPTDASPSRDETCKNPTNRCKHSKQNLNLLYFQEEHTRDKRGRAPYENDGEGADHPLPYSVRYLLSRSLQLSDHFLSIFGRQGLQYCSGDFLLASTALAPRVCTAVVAISFLASTALGPRVWSTVVATSALAPTSLMPSVCNAVVATSFLTLAPLEPRLCSAVVAASLLPSTERLAMSWTPCLGESAPLGSAIIDPSFPTYPSCA